MENIQRKVSGYTGLKIYKVILGVRLLAIEMRAPVKATLQDSRRKKPI
jgi:hypothetical protein